MADQVDTRPYTVVVGVSATSKSQAALRWAQHEVEQTHGRLIVVRAWRMGATLSPEGSQAVEIPKPKDVEADARRKLTADVAAALGADHQAELRLVRGGRLKSLLQAAAEADLLVVDAPRQLSAGPMFAHRLVYAASCPVVILPPARTTDAASTMKRVARSVGRGLVATGGSDEHPAYRPPRRM